MVGSSYVSVTNKRSWVMNKTRLYKDREIMKDKPVSKKRSIIFEKMSDSSSSSGSCSTCSGRSSSSSSESSEAERKRSVVKGSPKWVTKI